MGAIKYTFNMRTAGAAKELERLRKLMPKAFEDCVVEEARKILNRSLQMVPRNYGTLAKSAFLKRRGVVTTIGYNAFYARWVHTGIPGTSEPPPIMNFIVWAIKRFGSPDAAWVVRWNVHQEGWRSAPRGTPYLTQPVERMTPGIGQRVQACAERRLGFR